MEASASPVMERHGFKLFLLLLVAMAALFLGKAATGDAFVSTELVHRSWQPWRGVEPTPPPVHNENLADPPTVWLPMQAATRSMVRDWLLHHGEPPLWCSQSFGGAPWLGNMSSALFSPFTWLFVVLPFAPAFAIAALLKWLVAGVGAWSLAKEQGLSSRAAALVGIVFAFCGFQVVWISSCLTNVSVWAPWLLLAIDRLLERPDARRAALLALASWLVLVGGHPETSFWIATGAGVYALCRWVATPQRRGLKLALLLLGAALGGALAIVQWWPFLEYALHSFGQELRDRSHDLFRARSFVGNGPLGNWLGSVALLVPLLLGIALLHWPESRRRLGRCVIASLLLVICAAAGVAARQCGLRPTLLLELIPDWYGRSLDGGSYRGPFTYNDVTAGFAGGALFVFACAAAVVRLERGRVVALALAGIAVALRFFRVPGWSEAAAHVRGLATLGSTRALGMVALVVALLGGHALEELIERPKRMAFGAVAGLVFLGAVALTSDGTAARPNDDPVAPVAGTSLELPKNLTDCGPSGLGVELRGIAPADAARVRLYVNGCLEGDVEPAPAANDGRRPFAWRWIGSQRLEEGSYRVVAEALHADQTVQRFAAVDALAERPPQPSARWFVHLGALALVLLAALAFGPRLRSATLALATIGELAFFGAGYNDSTPPDRLPAASAPEPLHWLQQKRAELGPFRLFAARTHLHPNLHLLFDAPPIDVVRGYDALEPIDYVHVLNFLYRNQVEVPWLEMDFATLDFGGELGAQLADVLNIRYLMSEEPAPAGYVEVWRQKPAAGSLVLYENSDVLPRAFTVQRGSNALKVYAAKADLRTLAAWEGNEEVEFAGKGRVVAFDEARGRMRATVESDAGTILIVSENCDAACRDWRATIDGSSAAIRRTHGTLISVVVPAGRHEIELVYRPRAVTLGAFASGGALLALLVLLVMRRRAAERVDG